MLLSNIKLVIFDWDGTLADSLGYISHCLRLAARDFNLPEPTDAQSQALVGLGALDVIQNLFPDLSEVNSKEMVSCYRQHYFDNSKQLVKLFDGARETLDYLRSRGLMLAIATGKSRKGIDENLADTQTTDYFVMSRSSEETANKPDPMMINQILKHTEVLPEQAVMIGDTQFDLLMAQNANIGSIGVTYGAHKISMLQECEPLTCISDISQLRTLV